MSTFRRGFKSWCEITAAQFRVALGLKVDDPLNAERLARHIGVRVVRLEDVVGLGTAAIHQLTKADPGSWSAITVTAHSRSVVVVNPRSFGRVSNDLMHECSHLILNHKPSKATLSSDGQLLLSAYDRQQEDEANWLAPTLLLPRSVLLRIANDRIDLQEAADRYGTSLQLITMRMNVSGVAIQLRRRSA